MATPIRETESMASTSLSDSVVSSCQTSRLRVTEIRNRRMARLRKMQTPPSKTAPLSNNDTDHAPLLDIKSPASDGVNREQHEEELEDFLTRRSSSFDTARTSKSPRHRKSSLAQLRDRMASRKFPSTPLDANRGKEDPSFKTPASTGEKKTTRMVPKHYAALYKQNQSFESPAGLDSSSILKAMVPPSPSSAIKGNRTPTLPKSKPLARHLSLTPENNRVSCKARANQPTPVGSVNKRSVPQHSMNGRNDDSFEEIVLRQVSDPGAEFSFPLQSAPNPNSHNDSFEELVYRQRPSGGTFQSKKVTFKYASPTSVSDFMPPTHSIMEKRDTHNLGFADDQADDLFVDDDEESTESMRIMDVEVL